MAFGDVQTWALFTVATFKSWAGISSGSSEDSQIGHLANSVTKYLEEKCARQFVARAVTNEYIDGDGTDEIILKYAPYTSVGDIKMDAQHPPTTVVTSTTYQTTGKYAQMGIVKKTSGTWNRGTQNILIATYTAGYTTTTANALNDLADLVQVALQLAQRARLGIKDKSLGLQTVNTEGEAVTFNPNELTAWERDVIEKYTRRTLAVSP